MDFELNEQDQLIKDTARQFANEVVAPGANERDEKEIFPRDIIEKAAKLGFMGTLIPEEYGGSNLTDLQNVLVHEEINRACASTGVTMSVHNSLVSVPIKTFGSEDLKKKYLTKMATLDMLGAYALSEPDHGSDAGGMKSTYELKGDTYIINGKKMWITSGDQADVFVVFATSDRSLRTKGVSAFIVEKDFPGLSIGKKERKLGIRASTTTTLNFDNLEVPKENLLGEEGKGFKIAMHTLDGGRIGIAAQGVGIAQASLDRAVAYAKERKQFNKHLSEFQAIRWKLADMAMEIDAARMLTYRAATLRSKGVSHAREASMAKLFASETANRCARESVQIHGGWGYVREFEVERFYRDAKITEIYEGTSEIQRLVISREVLSG